MQHPHPLQGHAEVEPARCIVAIRANGTAQHPRRCAVFALLHQQHPEVVGHRVLARIARERGTVVRDRGAAMSALLLGHPSGPPEDRVAGVDGDRLSGEARPERWLAERDHRNCLVVRQRVGPEQIGPYGCYAAGNPTGSVRRHSVFLSGLLHAAGG
jgi:hypothetical protein